MAIGEHQPGKLYARNRGILRMSHQQLHDFAATKRTGLPQHVAPKKKKKRLSDVISTMKMRGAFSKRPAMPMARNRAPGPRSFGAGVD
jgi:hypothetical protein